MSDYKCQPASSHYVGGQYVEDMAGAPFDCINPTTGDVIARLFEATPALIDQAVQAATEAQAAWASMLPAELT